ncbi:MAG: FAD-dependent oxidoreductase, partial [Bacteroidota bacterium]
ILEKGDVLPSPSIAKLAQQLGFPSQATEEMYDVVIIGAGPAGLAAAVYGGSEGLKTLLVERRAPGGQAGSSSRIENYLGFPNGLSGQELTRRAVTQAKRFGIEFLAPAEVTNIGVSGEYKCLSLSDGQHVNAKSIIITTGVAYRHLTTTGVPDYTGAGVYYGSSMAEAQACSNQDVYIVGGGNSAGQAAVYLSRFAKSVNILIRRPDLTSSMSSYLIDQIAAIDTIQVHDHTVIEEARGADQRLTTLRLRHNQTEEIRDVHADALFIFIGSKPETNWIQLDLIKNDRGYIETGKSLMRYDEFKRSWKRDREPYNLETCIPGIFAAGDVRAGAMNRVASAVGEGSMAISHVHQYLAEI